MKLQKRLEKSFLDISISLIDKADTIDELSAIRKSLNIFKGFDFESHEYECNYHNLSDKFKRLLKIHTELNFRISDKIILLKRNKEILLQKEIKINSSFNDKKIQPLEEKINELFVEDNFKGMRLPTREELSNLDSSDFEGSEIISDNYPITTFNLTVEGEEKLNELMKQSDLSTKTTIWVEGDSADVISERISEMFMKARVKHEEKDKQEKLKELINEPTNFRVLPPSDI